MTATALDQSSNDIASTLESLRDEAVGFADRLREIQGRWNLQGFGAQAFFDKAVKEAYDRLRDAFLGNRMRFGNRPSIEDYEVRREFVKRLDCGDADLSTLDIKAAVSRAMDELNVLLPAEDAENEVNRQLAARFVSEFHIERKEVVQRSGAVVLDYRASIDSIDKKFSKRSSYSYFTFDWLAKQVSVLQEMVIHFNRNTGKCQSTEIPS